ncbi:MAG: tetratricopeptide repeat protein [Candidatus Omnitrophota bacterium]|nr:tetratricopeptide repeat protein [Candidatus Omnitrophota bacterium]
MYVFVLCLLSKGVKISKILAVSVLTAFLFLIIFPVSSFAITKNQAVEYREKGLKAQQLGDYDTALSYYQKSVELDPQYAVVYNDLGVVYESRGMLELAERHYLRAIELDANYLASYYNLAALYEKEDKPLSALYYWRKRVERGLRGEKWTEKARENLSKLALKSADAKAELKNIEATELAQQLSEQRRKEFENKVVSSRRHFQQGQKLYQDKENLKAVEEFNAALSLTPGVPEIIAARQEAIKDLLAKRIDGHYQISRKMYELGDYSAARAEINQALSLIPDASNQKSNP